MIKKPSRLEAENAIRTVLSYIGEDPEREGLKNTPARVISSYKEMFSGYSENIETLFQCTFTNTNNFSDLVLLKNIQFNSHCEHHLLPIRGTVDIGYYPNKRVIGISKLARLVGTYSKRLQIQEKMTAEIAESLQKFLCPLGVAIKISATHHCMSTRGVLQQNNTLETLHFTGIFQQETRYRKEFLTLCK